MSSQVSLDDRNPLVDLNRRCIVGFAVSRLKWINIGFTRDPFAMLFIFTAELGSYQR